jgi:hypothetical protein
MLRDGKNVSPCLHAEPAPDGDEEAEPAQSLGGPAQPRVFHGGDVARDEEAQVEVESKF